MMIEVDRVVQARSNSSPATSSDYNRASQEDIRRLDSRLDGRLRALWSVDDQDSQATSY